MTGAVRSRGLLMLEPSRRTRTCALLTILLQRVRRRARGGGRGRAAVRHADDHARSLAQGSRFALDLGSLTIAQASNYGGAAECSLRIDVPDCLASARTILRTHLCEH